MLLLGIMGKMGIVRLINKHEAGRIKTYDQKRGRKAIFVIIGSAKGGHWQIAAKASGSPLSRG